MKTFFQLVLIAVIGFGQLNAQSKVIFFAKKDWSNSPKGRCLWFNMDNKSEINIDNLDDYTFTYRECKTAGAHGEGPIEYDCHDLTASWGRYIESFYISSPYMVIELYDQVNYEGNYISFTGPGGCNLNERGWGNRARAIRVYYR